MNQVSNISNNYIGELYLDIIQYILDFTCIHCHTCKKRYTIDFYKKHGNFYYCSIECYNYI